MTVRLNGNKMYCYDFTLHSVWVKGKTDVDIKHHLQHKHGCFLRFELCSSIFPSVIWSLNVPTGITPHGIVFYQRRFPVHIHRCRWVGDAVNSPVDEWQPCPWMATLPEALPQSSLSAACINPADVWRLWNDGASIWETYCERESETQIKTLERLVEIAVYFVPCQENSSCQEHHLLRTTLLFL